MPIPAPEAWENAIPPYGIRAAKPTAQALKIPIALDRMARDVSTALEEFGLPPVVSSQSIAAGSAAARDAHWGIPANATQRLALQSSGATTIRTDTGTEERYYAALTDGGSNPGGRTSAGWYRLSVGAPLHAEYSTTVNLANGTDGTVGAMSVIPEASTDVDFVSLPAAGKVRLKAGLYAISMYVIWGAATTGLTLVGAKVGVEGMQRSMIPNGSPDGYFSKANVFIAADDTDVLLYLFQVTGGTRTVTGRVAITKVG